MTALEKTFQSLENPNFTVSDDKRKKVGNYLLERTLGGGSFGKVRLATHVLAREKVAVKVITKKAIALKDYLRKNLRREALVLQRLCHPNIVRLYEVMETENGYYMVLELAAGGPFVTYLSDRKRLTEAETRKFMRQLVSAVDHIHQSEIVHRDIKLENLLLDGKMNMKIIDFGLSNFCQGDQSLKTQCGSPAFTAPEVFSKRNYGPAVDIWSLGVNMFIMLTGRLPFETSQPSNLTRLYTAMLTGCSVPDTLSSGCQHLIQRMLDPKDTSRITIEELTMDPWLTEGFTEPIQRVTPVLANRLRAVSDSVIDYILEIVKLSEIELRKAIQSQKPNSFAAMHDLLADRLTRGVGLPARQGRGKDVRLSIPDIHEGQIDCGVSLLTADANGHNGNGVTGPKGGQKHGGPLANVTEQCYSGHSQEKYVALTNHDHGSVHKICTNCSCTPRADPEVPGPVDQEPGVNHLHSENLCGKCGEVITWAENAEYVLEKVLQLQRLLPKFQDIPDGTKGSGHRIGKGSRCNDIVSFLSDVDDETFDRALKLFRGYRNLPDPPTPPNSAYEGGRQMLRNGTSGFDDNIISRMGFRGLRKTDKKYHGPKTRKPGNVAELTVLPPIEKPTNSCPNLTEETISEAEERFLLKTVPPNGFNPQLVSEELSQRRRLLHAGNDITGADILSTIPPKRLGKLRQVSDGHEDVLSSGGPDKDSRSTNIRHGQVMKSRLRHSVAEDVPKIRDLALPKKSKCGLLASRKTAR